VEGRTIPEWTAEWWKWVMAFPTNQNPGFDPTGTLAHNGQTGSVFYLVGVFVESDTATRSITLQEGTYLFAPILNLLNNASGENPWGTITEQLVDSGAEFVALTTTLHASIDGVPLTNLCYTTGQPITNLFAHREVSPEFSLWMPPTNNPYQAFGFDLAGVLDPCYSDGYWVMLTPLPVGQHVVNFRGGIGPPSYFTVEYTYQITVRPLDLAQALSSLLHRVATAGLPAQHVAPLTASLRSAQTFFESGNLRAGINQLRVFQNKVRIHVADKTLADDLIRAAQRIIDAATRRLP
jgi:hypothetical protein